MKHLLKPWFWPLPACIISLVILATSKSVWVMEKTMNSKGVMVEDRPVSTMAITWFILLAVYGISFIPFFRDFLEGMTMGSKFVSQSSPEAEGGCAVILIRAFLLIGMYLLTYIYFKDYFFH